MIDTILFDLDGTLLPLDMDTFMKTYFGLLAKKCAPYGYDAQPLMDAVGRGTEAMVQNDGAETNETRFWQVFSEALGDGVLALRPVLERFYGEEFNEVRAVCGENPQAPGLLAELKAKGYTLVLATNPMFPLRAMHTRLAWLGIDPALFDHITSYETSHYCKPNPAYFGEILQTIGKSADQCVMIGNDLEEDGSARTLGMGFYLVTDHAIAPDGQVAGGMNSGSFAECCGWLRGKIVARR